MCGGLYAYVLLMDWRGYGLTAFLGLTQWCATEDVGMAGSASRRTG